MIRKAAGLIISISLQMIVCALVVIFLYDAGFERCFQAREETLFSVFCRLRQHTMDHGACSPVHGAADKICGGRTKWEKERIPYPRLLSQTLCRNGKGTWKNWRRNTFVFLKRGWYIPALEYSGCNERQGER